MSKNSSGNKSDKPTAHALVKDTDAGVRIVNGRLVSRTIADPDLQDTVRAAEKKLFSSREKTLEYFRKRGVLTKAGKLTKEYGG